MRENTDQEKLHIWTVFMQCVFRIMPNSYNGGLPKIVNKTATVDRIIKIIKGLNASKAIESDKIPVNIVKMSACTIDKQLI